jgi:hypothetical protein
VSLASLVKSRLVDEFSSSVNLDYQLGQIP